jgi:hypothetical protein
MDWVLMAYEDFEWEDTYPFTDTLWNRYDFSDDGFERSWGVSHLAYYSGQWSAWPAAAGDDGYIPDVTGGYTDNLKSWMVYGPFDFTGMDEVLVDFAMYYDTEEDYDFIKFCASIDGEYFDCYYWSGHASWDMYTYAMTSYANYPEVWFAWIFKSDDSFSDYYGAYIDDIWVYAHEIDDEPTPTPEPDPTGNLIENGSFETGDLTGWFWFTDTMTSKLSPSRSLSLSERDALKRQSITWAGVLTDTYVDGEHSTYLWYNGAQADFLVQAVTVPTDVTDIVLNFWFAVTTLETEVEQDYFCGGLWNLDPIELVVDMGCMDAMDTTGYWQEVLYTLAPYEVAEVAGKPVALMFELYNTGAHGTGTAGWLDYVRLYATGSDGGSYLDLNEPNDDYTTATLLSCGETITGVVGEALGGYDLDLFRLDDVPTGQVDIDIAAESKIPPSDLDSVVALWDDGGDLLAWNDDDGVSYDSYVTYTNEVTESTFYVSVESYSGAGSPDSFYDLTVQCAGTGDGPPAGADEQPDVVTDTWTVMLYLNAEDHNFVSTLTQYRTDIESFIGSKSDFLTVTMLYDAPSSGDSMRYVVQPGGVYVDGINRWMMGELNMGHPDTLANFVTWSMDQFPADHYYLAVDDHGDGVYGISFDATSNNDQLTPPELYSALKRATQNGNRKIDIFDYEACLMGLMENAYDLKDWVDYVVFFEQISWGIDTYPQYFYDLAVGDSPLVVGQRIVDRYYSNAVAEGYPHTISFIDTGQLGALRQAVSDFGDALVTANDKPATKAARDQSQAFAADDDATNPYRAEYIDLWDLADNAAKAGLASSQAAAVKSAVDAAVVHERHASGGVSGYAWDHSGVHGLSIYYPNTQSSSAFNGYTASSSPTYQMSRDGKWDEFLAWVVEPGDRRGMNSARAEIKLLSGDTYVLRLIYLPTLLRNF